MFNIFLIITLVFAFFGILHLINLICLFIRERKNFSFYVRRDITLKDRHSRECPSCKSINSKSTIEKINNNLCLIIDYCPDCGQYISSHTEVWGS